MEMNKGKKDVSAVEDLMKEHGILNRILLIYEEVLRRMENDVKFNILILHYSALIIRKFIEDHHERTEEKYVFPVLQKHKKYIYIVNELYKQHKLGRMLTNLILKNSKPDILMDRNIILYIRLFIKMYRQHEAYEDTIIFPEFKKLLTKEEYKRLGEMFEEEEEKIIGKNGFHKYLDIIDIIEKYLEINNLNKISNEIEASLPCIRRE
jgi:hemerythrin-like domain-containing protein